jgi:alpha-ribazole phosphatase
MPTAASERHKQDARQPDARTHNGLHIVAWRHPKPLGAQGRCIGRTDLPLDRRKAKRLAHGIRRAARLHGWPRVVYSSPLQRCALVGRQLKRWGWRHHVDAALLEMDFGSWDGQLWQHIALSQIDQWCADFLGDQPGDGESLRELFERVAAWLSAQALGESPAGQCVPPRLVVAHAGWMQACAWLATGQPWPTLASQWSRPPGYGQVQAWRWRAGEQGALMPGLEQPCSPAATRPQGR